MVAQAQQVSGLGVAPGLVTLVRARQTHPTGLAIPGNERHSVQLQVADSTFCATNGTLLTW